jgi:cytochrome d ubiquinol oxidase subunit II
VLFVAFPSVLASGLSGFYFAIILVLWMLILRGISIEFRSHVEHPLWRAAWDFIFAAASLVLRCCSAPRSAISCAGFPLGNDGWFSLALFTDFTAKAPVGILDWYTVLSGVFALLAIAGHGGAFLAWKTDGPVQERSRRIAMLSCAAVAVLWPLATVLTRYVNAPMLEALPGRPLAWLSLALRGRRLDPRGSGASSEARWPGVPPARARS